MYETIAVKSPEQLEQFCALPGPAGLTPETVARQRPDGGWLVAGPAGATVARCSVWWTDTPSYPAHRLGLIGHYAAADPAAATRLLCQAQHQLAVRGCTLAVGPMDGSTWARYRLLTERGSEPPFFLEPDNPDDWPAHFVDQGFGPLARYYSTVTDQLTARDPRLPRIAQRLESDGVIIRTVNPADLAGELHRVYQVALSSFSGAPLFSPLAEADFAAEYVRLGSHLVPELVLVAERQGDPLGFLFAVPDLLQAGRGRAPDTAIIKTLAIHPAERIRAAGLGTLLAARCHAIARGLGYRRVIHALMHESNLSRNMSARYASKVIRRYTLFARTLSPAP